MIVRRATPEDAAALHAFATQLALDHPPDPQDHERVLKEAIDDDRSLVLIAEADGTPLGSLVAGLLPMPMYGGQLAFLQELYVDDQARGTGVGKALMAAFDEWARERGAKVEALATSRPAAIGFYQRLGFVTRPTMYYWRVTSSRQAASR